MSAVRRSVLLLVLAGAALGAGCNGDGREPTPEEANLKKLMILFGQYRGQHRGQVPQTAAQFKDWLRKLDSTMLERQGVDPNDLDKILVSSRDGKPFVWRDRKRSGTPGGIPSPGDPGGPGMTVMLYEQEGKDGKRLVADEHGKVEEIDEAAFRKLVPEAR